ncbi:hypothetical protein EVG20_g9126 [Dentipellis fragilis]|uniref:Uncharacterized protein n=1 Tax=Dentipellis fragilis TaxID=205917 RepID=A0A4Y9Y0S6_9AGAM|nr:hypothetical protein EVG20_g9126 [Dentipellis fragilis]
MCGFLPGPSTRGTLDILWACVSTIVICAWTSLHPDIYIPKDLRPPDFQGSPRKFALVLTMLISPEVVLAIAISEYFEVHNAVRDVNTAFPACAWTQTDGYYAVMDGYVYDGKVVDVEKILELMRNGDIGPIPSNAPALRDRSKADSLAKFIACFQVAWLMIQCLARTVEHLPMTTLELGTVGYALITVMIYGFQWHKPQDVRTYTVLQPKATPAAGPVHSAVELASVTSNAENDTGSMHDIHENGEHAGRPNDEHGDLEEGQGGRIPSNTPMPEASLVVALMKKYETSVVYLVLAIGSPVYGVWHCLAWNFSFPSRAEMWLWRVDSVLCVTVGTVVLLLFWHYRENVAPWITVLLFVHIASRVVIVVEMFVGLRSLPPGVFETVQWTMFIPHI